MDNAPSVRTEIEAVILAKSVRPLQKGKSSELAHRRREVLKLRYGLAGQSRTQVEIARHLSVSPQAIHSLLATMARASLPADFLATGLPAIAALRCELKELAPTRVDEAAQMLDPMLCGMNLIDIARFCAQIIGEPLAPITEASDEISQALGGQVILGCVQRDSGIVDLTRACRAWVKRYGAMSFIEACNHAPDDWPEEDVKTYLTLHTDFEWLDEGQNWFWYGPKQKNSLTIVAGRILSIAGVPVRDTDIHAALAHYLDTEREIRACPQLDPTVVEAVLQHMSFAMQLADGRFIAAKKINIGEIFSKNESRIISHLNQNPRVNYTRSDICEALGLSSAAVTSCLRRSVVMHSHSPRSAVRLLWQSPDGDRKFDRLKPSRPVVGASEAGSRLALKDELVSMMTTRNRTVNG